ncbi:hypothetical protein GCM10027422_11550 [Hymenobacter arcticus]
MSNSCKKEDDVVPCNASADVTTTQLPGFVAIIPEPVPNVGQSNTYVVNSAAEYRALFGGKTLPPVDFSAYTLLAGKTRTASCSYVQAQHVRQTCAGYTYTVQLAADAGDLVSNVVYYVLVPRLPLAAKVELEVQLPLAGAAESVSAVDMAK